MNFLTIKKTELQERLWDNVKSHMFLFPLASHLTYFEKSSSLYWIAYVVNYFNENDTIFILLVRYALSAMACVCNTFKVKVIFYIEAWVYLLFLSSFYFVISIPPDAIYEPPQCMVMELRLFKKTFYMLL